MGKNARHLGAGTRRARSRLRSTATAVVTTTALVGTMLGLSLPAGAAPVGQGFNLNRSDIRFILNQISIAERHAATRTAENPCGTLLGTEPDQIPNGNQQGAQLPWGLRTVDGTCNNLLPGQEKFGAADTLFPRLVPAKFRQADEGDPDGPFGPAPRVQTSYAQTRGTVIDASPRQISNLIVDQTTSNPAARAAAGVPAPAPGDAPAPVSIDNTAPDVGLSAPFNGTFTLFGQFFDHGLDLVAKSGGTVYMPLKTDDPLYEPGSPLNFMVLTRAKNGPGPDGISGDNPATPGVDESADDVREHANSTTPFVDQNQTYTSHPSHQAFLREYVLDPGPDGIRGDLDATPGVDEGADDTSTPVDTGHLLEGPSGSGLAPWSWVKEEALAKLGIILEDADVLDVPMLATDPYGNLTLTDSGRPQIVTRSGLVATEPTGTALPADTVRTGHAFLDDIAHHAQPRGDANPADGPGPVVDLEPDADTDAVTDDNDPATYDDEMLGAHFLAGDGRTNENIGLTAIHHVFHSEHNRLVEDIDNLIRTTETQTNIDAWHRTDGPSGWDYGQRLFQAARFVTEMEYQHLVFEEFARKIQPMVNLFGEGGTGYRTNINPAIRAEFAHAVYRFGHSMLTDEVARVNADGSRNDIGLIEAFLNPQEFTDGGSAGPLTPNQGAGSILRGMGRQVGQQIDEFVVEALRNNLLGLPLDLATINIARGRDAGVPTLNEARRAIHDETANSALAPYESWADFAFGLRTQESLVNFVAAYGRHPLVQAATTTAERRAAAQEVLDLAGQTPPENPSTPEEVELAQSITEAYDFLNGLGAWANENGATVTGVDDIDLWMGGLAEKPMVFGGMLGSTFNYVFETQMEDLQDGDRFYYLSRTAGLNLLTQLEGNSLAELMMRNTDVESLPADAFSRPDFVFQVSQLGTSGAITDDPGTDWNESTLLTRMPDGTIRFGGGEHVVFNGTDGNNKIRSSEGDDTIRGNDGNDRMEGGDGNDHHIGGLGDDILTDVAGDDVLKGGDGDDALSSGQGFAGDLNMGGRGKDFIVGGNDMTESFAGPGDDFVFAGDAEDTVFGDDGDDWIEDGKGPFSLLQGDNGAPFQDDPNEPGHDVLNGDGGEQDYDAEGGDDIMMAGAGIQRSEGMLGFDWVTHQGDPLAADSDMNFIGALPPGVEVNRDRFDLVESLSGWKFDDVLKGDDRETADIGAGHELTQEGIDRIVGLAGTLPPDTTAYSGGNIIVGGTGSDQIEGRGGDDVIDGDKWLHARLSVRTDPADPSTEIGSAEHMRGRYLAGSTTTLQQAVFAGQVDPGNIVIVREMLDQSLVTDRDAAVFAGPFENYTFTTEASGWITVTDTVGTEGTDWVRNVEELRFADRTIDLTAPPAAPEIGGVRTGDRLAVVNFAPVATDFPIAIDEFHVQVLVDGVVVRTVGNIPADATSARITALTNGTEYTFRVLAVNRFGASEPSPESDPVTPSRLSVVTVPASGDTDFPIGGNLTATFNRQATTTNWGSAVTLRNTSTGVLVPRVVTYDPDTMTVTVDPRAALTPGTSYTLRLNGTGPLAIQDQDGSRLPTTTVQFTTWSDTVAPTVTSSTPAEGGTGVALSASPVVDFSERIVGVDASTVTLENVATGATVTTTLTLNAAGTRLTVDPQPQLARNTRYRVTLVGGTGPGIRDVWGNALATSAITFTTRP